MRDEEMNFSEIYPKLFIGSAPICLPPFDVIVFSAKEHQPIFDDPPKQTLIYVELRDAKPTSEERSAALRTACAVSKALKEGKSVLVTCAAGMNRSALIAGLALRMLKVPTRKIVQAVRRVRGPEALANPYFLSMLEAV